MIELNTKSIATFLISSYNFTSSLLILLPQFCLAAIRRCCDFDENRGELHFLQLLRLLNLISIEPLTSVCTLSSLVATQVASHDGYKLYQINKKIVWQEEVEVLIEILINWHLVGPVGKKEEGKSLAGHSEGCFN